MDRETYRNMTEDSPECKAMFRRFNRKLAFWRYFGACMFAASVGLAAWLIFHFIG
jgi:hypothetical protein